MTLMMVSAYKWRCCSLFKKKKNYLNILILPFECNFIVKLIQLSYSLNN